MNKLKTNFKQNLFKFNQTNKYEIWTNAKENKTLTKKWVYK